MELTPDRMIRNLKYVSKLYEKKFYGFGEIRISDMVDDCIKMIESQQKQIEELQKQFDAANNDIKQYARVKELCISNESECAMDKSDNWCERCPAWEYKGKGANK